MGRWEPDARGRLEQAAMELYARQGFEQTTVAQIAERAGLTERTFFRYYPDKREVLFGGSGELRDAIVAAVESAPTAAGPLEAVASGLAVAAQAIEGRREAARRRHQIVLANAELYEREVSKLASWAVALGDALRGRGVAETPARLAGEIGIALFRSAFEAWIAGPAKRPFPQVLHESFAELRALAATGSPATASLPSA